METDEIKDIWLAYTPENVRTRDELESTFLRALKDSSDRFQRRIKTDLLISLLLVVIMILAAGLAGFQYWPEVAAVLTVFSLALFMIYRLHRRAVSLPTAQASSLLSMLKQVSHRLISLANTWRLAIPVGAALLFTWYVYRFGQVSLAHLLWILPVIVMVNEGIIRIMYGRTLRELKELKEEIESQP